MPSPFRALTLAAMAVALMAPVAVPVVEAMEIPRHFDVVGLDQLDADGIALATSGVVATMGDRQVVADAARYDIRAGDLFVTGNVVFRQPEVRIAAARLGLHLPPGHRDLTDFSGIRGDAWEVEARVTTHNRTLRIRAERVEIDGQRIVFHGVDLDLGHGGIMSFSAPKVILTLRQLKPGEDRKNIRSQIEGVALVSPTGRVIGLPVIWLPYLYRDFSRRYPWTRVRGGYTRRQGTYGRFWIGTDLPQVGGWRPGVHARIEDNSRAGAGFGLRPYWEHERFGKGDAEWFVMPSESVRGGDGEGEELQERRAEFFDAQHRVNLGRGAGYLRYTRQPGGDVPGTPPDYRFMQDYLPERLENDPFPRQGATVAYGVPGVTATVDTERRTHPDSLATERWYGLQAQVHPLQLAGPLHAAADTWVEDLHQVQLGSEATRLTTRGWLGAGYWLPGGVGLDADAGLKELRYTTGEISGIEQEDAARLAPFSDAGIKLRLQGDLSGVTHTIIPRVGVQLVGRGSGEELPDYQFDARDRFEEDVRYWITELDTAVVSDRTLFHADLVGRWAMREQERRYLDDSGQSQLSPHSLVDLTGTVDGKPIDPLQLSASFVYDARPRRWTSFNTDAVWRVAEQWSLTEASTLIPDTGEWSHTPGVSLFTNRYRTDLSTTFRPTGAAVDGWLVQFTRRMVDGDFFLGYQFLRDTDGVVSDRRVSIGFTLAGGNGFDEDQPQAKTSLSR